MFRAVLDHVRDDPCFHDNSRVDQFLGVDLVEGRVKSEVLRHPLPVEFANDQPDAGFRMHDAEELQGFGGFSQAESADAELFGKLGFGGKPISGLQSLRNDQLPNLFRDPVADKGSRQRGKRFAAGGRGNSLFCAGHLRPLLSIR